MYSPEIRLFAHLDLLFFCFCFCCQRFSQNFFNTHFRFAQFNGGEKNAEIRAFWDVKKHTERCHSYQQH